MPLIGDQQDEDRALMADLVVAKMNETVPRTSAPTPVRSQVNTLPSKHAQTKLIFAQLYNVVFFCIFCDANKVKCPMVGTKCK